ncbi:MAG: sortase [Actinomycetes bacterium]
MAVLTATAALGFCAPASAAPARANPIVSGEANPAASTAIIAPRAATRTRTYYATVTVRRAHIKNLPVVRHIGTPDDGPGTVIQNRGLLSAPFGSWGGVEPGEIGSFFLAGHRSSHGAPLRLVPGLLPGDAVTVTRAGVKYVYIVAYRLTANFRSAASKLAQLAPVPGYPGTVPTRPAIVLSTCATPEDKAAKLRWHDRFGNPTHRYNIVGFLAGTLASATAPTATDITSASATVSSMVTPGTGPTTVSFSYSTDPQFPVGAITTVSAGTIVGPGDQTVSASLAGLTPATTYYVRADTRVAAGIATGTATSFTTE